MGAGEEFGAVLSAIKHAEASSTGEEGFIEVFIVDGDGLHQCAAQVHHGGLDSLHQCAAQVHHGSLVIYPGLLTLTSVDETPCQEKAFSKLPGTFSKSGRPIGCELHFRIILFLKY